MSEVFDDILHEHEALLHDMGNLRQSSHKGDLVQRAQNMVRDASEAGAAVSDIRRRAQLAGIIRFWEEEVYRETGEMPRVSLRPAVGDDGPRPDIGSQVTQPIDIIPNVRGSAHWWPLALVVAVMALGIGVVGGKLIPSSINIDTSSPGQVVYCAPGVRCLVDTQGSFQFGIFARDNLGVLPMVRVQGADWYPQKAARTDVNQGVWTCTAQIGDDRFAPLDQHVIEMIALLVRKEWLVDVGHLGPIADYTVFRPAQVSQPKTVRVVWSLANVIAPQIGSFNAKDVAFSDQGSDCLAVSADWDAAAQSWESLRLVYDAAKGAYAGWSIVIPENASFSASAFSVLHIRLASVQGGGFEVKLKDTSGREASVKVTQYGSPSTGTQDFIIPLEEFRKKEPRLQTDRVQVLTIGFNRERGSSAVTIGRIAFE